ncbi:MAG: hypothetical protein ACXWJM_07060 [Ramlibacter sp.]
MTALSLRRAALVLDIGRQRTALRESTAALREQFAWLGLAAMAGQSLRNRGWARVLTLGALAITVIRRMRATGAD